MTEAKINAIGMIFMSVVMLVALGLLIKRFFDLRNDPCWENAAKIVLDLLLSFLGLQLGTVLLGNMFIGLALGIFFSIVISQQKIQRGPDNKPIYKVGRFKSDKPITTDNQLVVVTGYILRVILFPIFIIEQIIKIKNKIKYDNKYKRRQPLRRRYKRYNAKYNY